MPRKYTIWCNKSSWNLKMNYSSLKMKKKQIINCSISCIFFLIIIALIPNILSQSHLIEVDYSFYNNTSHNKKIDFSDFLLRVNTENDSICKYSLTKDLSYSNMEGNFDLNSGKIHEKSFTELGDGLYRYFIKCYFDSLGIEPALYEQTIVVNSFISAKVVLSKEAPLGSGRVDITLITTKIVSGSPSLSYSYDGITYNDLPLFGSEKIWKGYLIIPKDIDEKVISFKFKANDLEGRQGNLITSGNVFFVDTVKPKTISYITSTGYNGKIRLEWYFDEDIKEYNVYRSNEPNPDYTDFYKSSDSTIFDDNLVEKGKTYYYRISAVDFSGNEGDLSKEIYSTALIDNNSISSDSGLDIGLLSYVDNLIVDIDNTIADIDNIKASISSRPETEKNLFIGIGLESELDNSKSEINNLKKETERIKLQDLSKDELNKKLDSLKLKLNVLRKKIPENMLLVDESTSEGDYNDDIFNEIYLLINPDISEKEIKNNIKNNLKVIESVDLKIKNYFYNLEVVYLDGTKEDKTVLKRDISSVLENQENLSFIEVIPKEIVESSDEIIIKSGDYQVLEKDPILSYSSDTKKIFYFFNKKISLDSLKKIKFSLIYQDDDYSIDNSNQGITGYFLYFKDNMNYSGIFIGILFAAVLFIYLVYSRKEKFSRTYHEIIKKLEEATESLAKEDIKKTEETYKSINGDYKFLNNKEKKYIYSDLTILHDKILLLKIKKGLMEFEKTKDLELFKRLENTYNLLSLKSKKQISSLFEKIKKEL
jgi:hypothetical protein